MWGRIEMEVFCLSLIKVTLQHVSNFWSQPDLLILSLQFRETCQFQETIQNLSIGNIFFFFTPKLTAWLIVIKIYSHPTGQFQEGRVRYRSSYTFSISKIPTYLSNQVTSTNLEMDEWGAREIHEDDTNDAVFSLRECNRFRYTHLQAKLFLNYI